MDGDRGADVLEVRLELGRTVEKLDEARNSDEGAEQVEEQEVREARQEGQRRVVDHRVALK